MKINTFSTKQIILRGTSFVLAGTLALSLIGCSKNTTNNVTSVKPNQTNEQPKSEDFDRKITTEDVKKTNTAIDQLLKDYKAASGEEPKNFVVDYSNTMIMYCNGDEETRSKLNKSDREVTYYNIIALSEYDVTTNGQLSNFWLEMQTSSKMQERFKSEVTDKVNQAIKSGDYSELAKISSEYKATGNLTDPFENTKVLIFFGTVASSGIDDKMGIYKEIQETFGAIMEQSSKVSQAPVRTMTRA